MTHNGNLKRRVRARASKTGESYTAALRHVRMPKAVAPIRSIRLAVAQTSLLDDPGDIAALQAVGAEMRVLMEKAHEAGARLVHFPEGATCAPNKRIMSEDGPSQIGAANWKRFEWDALRQEIRALSELAKRLKLWTVFGSVHELSQPHRPHNSLFVISDRGGLVTRYDERMLSNTKLSFMYSPGTTPVTFAVDDICFGCALGMESHYPEIFSEYERLGVDCVLFSTTGEIPSAAPPFAAEVLGHAASSTYWVSYSAHAPQSISSPSGIAGPLGRWEARCSADGNPSIAVADIAISDENLARQWRRKARADLYIPHQVKSDPRSDERGLF